jgi:predicted dehydrogenase
MSKPTRRVFLAASAAPMIASRSYGFPANESVTVGIMGMGGRGNELMKELGKLPNVNVAYFCDPDAKRMQTSLDSFDKAFDRKPELVGDFRRVLDDKAVNVLFVTAPNHWHAPAAIAACNADKHVYVEKPCSHNPHEGALLVAAAEKHKRHVQMGNQRRSWPKIREAMEFLQSGGLGRVYFAQSWYTNNRLSIGKGVQKEPPSDLNYDLWQGPAPRKPFRSNYLHYNWHWFWHWGNGELGNNGIHMIDLCRWGLGVSHPIGVRSAGGRYRFQDDQETPDTHHVAYDFAEKATIVWEGFSCNTYPTGKAPADVLFQGEKGSLAIRNGGYVVYDPKGKEIRKETGPGGNVEHLTNFLETVRGNAKLNSPVSEGSLSVDLCHLGNIAHRFNRSLKVDDKMGTIVGDPEAMTLWKRSYEPGWEPKVV